MIACTCSIVGAGAGSERKCPKNKNAWALYPGSAKYENKKISSHNWDSRANQRAAKRRAAIRAAPCAFGG